MSDEDRTNKDEKKTKNNDNGKGNTVIAMAIIIVGLLIVFLLLINQSMIEMSYETNDNISVDIKNITVEGGNFPVLLQDQDTDPIDFYFADTISGPYTLNTNTVIDTYYINLTSSVGLNVGDYIGFFQDSDSPFAYFGFILAINGNNLTMDTPLPIEYNTSLTPVLFELDRDISNADGSVNTVIYQVDNSASQPIDITRVMFSMTTDTVPDFSDFGDIAGGLTRGLVLRKMKADGTYYNIFNFKTNKDFANVAFDYDTYLATNPGQGVNGISVRLTFAGQEKHGVVIRLAQNESFEILVQDDLTDILTFFTIAEGHFTN